MSEREPTKILFIAGLGRIGSTLLGNILGQVPSFFHAGELRSIWQEKMFQGWHCGCGNPVQTCSTWGQVVEQAYGGWEGVDRREMLRGCERGRSRHTPLMLTGLRRFDSGPDREFLDRLERLYRAIEDVLSCRVIVDSSKYPGYGYALQRIPTLDVRVLHLVRDPRAVAYACRYRVKRLPTGPPGKTMPKYNLARTTMYWNASNAASEALFHRNERPYLRMRYEDFVAAPVSAIQRILEWNGTPSEGVPLEISENKIVLRATHTVSGNPSRFNTGAVAISPDSEWRSGLSRKGKATVAALAWPLMLRYGYLRRESGSRDLDRPAVDPALE